MPSAILKHIAPETVAEWVRRIEASVRLGTGRNFTRTASIRVLAAECGLSRSTINRGLVRHRKANMGTAITPTSRDMLPVPEPLSMPPMIAAIMAEMGEMAAPA